MKRENIWSRPSWDAYWLAQAALIATRGTCARRMVGCAIVSEDQRLLSSGYNGVPPGDPHCLSEPCQVAGLPSGSGREGCKSSHAEISALASLRGGVPHSVYSTLSPCLACVKALRLTSIKRVVFLQPYNDQGEAESHWVGADRVWIHNDDQEDWSAALAMALGHVQIGELRRCSIPKS